MQQIKTKRNDKYYIVIVSYLTYKMKIDYLLKRLPAAIGLDLLLSSYPSS